METIQKGNNLEGRMNQMVDEENNDKVTRRGFLGMLAGLGATIGLGGVAQAGVGVKSKDEQLNWSHPLYEVLYENADSQELKDVVWWLSTQNYEAAAFALIPNYFTRKNSVSSQIKKVRNPGGDNPTYWVALLLAYEGIGDPKKYEGRILRPQNFDTKIPIPKNQNILNFAEHIIPAWRPEGIINRLNKIPEFAKLFNYNSKN